MPKYYVTGFTEGGPVLPKMEVDCPTMTEAVFRYCFVIQHASAFVCVNQTGLDPHDDDHTRHTFPTAAIWESLETGSPLLSTTQRIAFLQSAIDQQRARIDELEVMVKALKPSQKAK